MADGDWLLEGVLEGVVEEDGELEDVGGGVGGGVSVLVGVEVAVPVLEGVWLEVTEGDDVPVIDAEKEEANSELSVGGSATPR